MPEIEPIAAVTYATSGLPDLSDRIAPPYDVLDARSKSELLVGSPYNIVALDLPHLPAKTVGPDHAYQHAGEVYRTWLREGVLRRRSTPALFVYQQTFAVDDQVCQRRGVIANVRVQPFGPDPDGRGGIYPHEQTFAAAREDRLRLMRSTRAQLSAIFGLFGDPDGAVAPILTEVIDAKKPLLHGTTTKDGVLHEVWALDDAKTVAALQQQLGAKDILIADGHHRYHTALTFKNELVAQGKDPGAAAFCLFVLVSIQDPGLIVLPTHRVLCGLEGFSAGKLLAVLADRDDLAAFATVHGPDQLAELQAALAGSGHCAMGLYEPASSRCYSLNATMDGDPLKSLLPDRPEAWRKLDVAVLHELLIDRVLRTHFGGQSLTIHYTADLGELRTLAETAQPGAARLGVILQATPLDAVRRVREACELMPPKSTYFYPKLATGLVINPLD